MNSFDFVVVGSGSAGAIVAARLSENRAAQVLVLEAGGSEFPANVASPPLWITLIGSNIDWGYTSVSQPGLAGRPTYEPRGKLPGGTGNMHAMMYVRGHPSDYDNWAYNGCPGWGSQDVLPYFQKIEDQEDSSGPWAGKGGPLHVANAGLHEPHPSSEVFINACRELGYPYTEDINGPNMEGTGWQRVNIKHGVRQNSWTAYLQPALERSNLTLRTNAQATRLLFEGKRCIGVEYSQNGSLERAQANHEVILCAGVMESPKLLLLSGIGHPAQLKQFGIPVVAEVPGVGENFHNHVLAGVIRNSSKPLVQGKQSLSESILFCRSAPDWAGPDLQLIYVHIPFDPALIQENPNAFSILPAVVRPLSRGWIRLANSDPLAKPVINPNYLGVESDRERLVQGVKVAREIFATRAFSSWVGAELLPGPDVRNADDLLAFVTQRADTFHHQAGSCKMGLDSMAVVDPKLRVHLVEGLRVADASVMPSVLSSNCNAGIMMIGEKAADLIKQTHGL